MNFSNYRFTLDMQKSKTQASLPVHFGDTGNRFYITLTDGGNPYIIGDGCRVDICIKKPNGVPLINACIIENNALVRYDFNKNTASVDGIHKCELRLYSSEGRLITTPYFIMVVDQNIFYDDEIGTDEDFQKLTALDVIAKEEERRVAEFERWEAEELRALAEKNRVAAEESRVDAENERKEAEAARVLAENARVEAENERGQELDSVKEDISNHEERIVSTEDNIWYNMERLDSHDIDISIHSSQISNHEERITGIERYLGGDNFIVDDSTAYEKTVPKNACEKAKVLSIGGMTYKKKTDEGNLMPYPYVGIGGLSYKVANGAITVTSGEETDFIISSGDAVYPAGTYVFEVGEQESNYVQQIGLQFYGTAPTVTQLSNYKCQFTATSNFTITRFTARISSSSSQLGEFTVTLHPMLYKTDEPIIWQPRGYYMSHTKVKAIESKGANGTIDTFTVPEVVQNREWYGLGVNENYYNYVEYANGRVILTKRAKEFVVIQVGYVAWASEGYSNVDYYAFKLPTDYIGYATDAFMLDGFKEKPTHSKWDSTDFVGVATGKATEYEIWVGFPKGTTQTEAEEALLGKSLVYALATPEVEDITDLMPKENLIKVLGGYKIAAVNEHSDPVPFSIKYLVTYPKGG